MSSELVTTKITSIDPNPLRRLKDYPFNEKKLEALMRSIADVGLWEGVIGRRKGNRIEIAFGHHRLEAARRSELTAIPIIVRDLTDEEMLQFMGRENLEDYAADFLVMLETWEAAVAYLKSRFPEKKLQDVETARLLGWTRLIHDTNMVNMVAEACSNAAYLIAGGYMTRDQLEGLSVMSVREICGRVVAQHEALEKMAKQTGRSATEVERGKKASGAAGKRVARGVRGGKIAPRDIRGQVDVEAYRHAKDAKKQSPLFAMFAKSLVDSIARLAKDDTIQEKLTEIKKALGKLTMDDDIHVVKRIAFECEGAAKRFDKWAGVFSDPKKKVVPFKTITKR